MLTTKELNLKSQTDRLHGLQSVFKSWLSLIYSKNSPLFVQLDSFLSFLKEPITVSYSQSSYPSAQIHNLF